jgi:hypothetical protein
MHVPPRVLSFVDTRARVLISFVGVMIGVARRGTNDIVIVIIVVVVVTASSSSLSSLSSSSLALWSKHSLQANYYNSCPQTHQVRSRREAALISLQ